MFPVLAWVMRLLRRDAHEISRKGLPRYLTRWTLYGSRSGGGQKLYLHCFHRGDAEDYFHDHPWPFWSLILWGGYWELTESGRRWYGPGSLLRRPAEHRHRVEVPPGQTLLDARVVRPETARVGLLVPHAGLPALARAPGQPGPGRHGL
jgi:hypothetical protein